MQAAWTRCPSCPDYWCNLHQQHVHDCPCPPIEEWDTDPYLSTLKRLSYDSRLCACGCGAWIEPPPRPKPRKYATAYCRVRAQRKRKGSA